MLKDDFYGDKFRWFVGVVKQIGIDKSRVRVRIFGVHKIEDKVNVSDGDLPWALVTYPTTGSQAGDGTVSHGLKEGSWVFGFFADYTDCQQPIILGVLEGGPGASDNSSTTGGAVAPGVPGQASDQGSGVSSDNSVASDTGTINLRGVNNKEKAYNFFREKLEAAGQQQTTVHEQVCGILGNLIEESRLDPNSNVPDDSGARAYGIAQWRQDRLAKLFQMYGSSPTLEQQLSYVWYELNTTETKAKEKLFRAKTVLEATEAFVWFERPKCCKRGGYVDYNHETWKRRPKYAQEVYNTVKYTPSTS